MNLDFSAINESKNLLAFSAGVDSCALFFLLQNKNIPFDIAIVNYNTREQSKEELHYAKDLAKKYNKKIFIKDVQIENFSNFEKKARDIRYSFFENLISTYNYNTLITAHQLNDKLEWFMMQLSKGAGLIELIGFNTWEIKQNYKIFKPMLDITKQELLEYLKEQEIKYFVDESNYDEKYKRNYFRHNFSEKFLDEFKDGVKNSFKYLENDLGSLNITNEAIFEKEELEVFENKNDDNINIRIIDLNLKKRGFLLSAATRKEILEKKDLVISHKISIGINDKYIFIAPYISNVSMDKKFKEKCRVKKIPKNIRAYLFYKKIDLVI